MSDIQLMIQSTPNPNALKFVVNQSVKQDGNFTYAKGSDTSKNPLAQAIFELDNNIDEVYFFDNYITVTQNGNTDWDDLEGNIRAVVLEKMPSHDPNFETPEADDKPKFEIEDSPEIDQINVILDQTVRPALQMDGGDIQVVSYKENIVNVFYQGACGSW